MHDIEREIDLWPYMKESPYIAETAKNPFLKIMISFILKMYMCICISFFSSLWCIHTMDCMCILESLHVYV